MDQLDGVEYGSSDLPGEANLEQEPDSQAPVNEAPLELKPPDPEARTFEGKDKNPESPVLSDKIVFTESADRLLRGQPTSSSAPVLDERTMRAISVSLESATKDSRRAPFVLPWETNAVTAALFGGKLKRPALQVPLPSRELLAASDSHVPEVSVLKASVPDFARKRLRFAALVKSEDDARFEALRKFKVLVMLEPDVSQLGRTLLAEASLLKQDAELLNTFADAFAGKSTATLVKRSASLWRYASWVCDMHLGSVLQPKETVMYAYMCHLKIGGAPTVASSFLEAWRFLHASVGLKRADPASVISSRVSGAARSMLADKRPLTQASPLSVKMVKALEQIVLLAPYEHWKIMAGHLLLSLGSSCRFSDSMSLASLTGEQAGDIFLIEAESRQYKTANCSKNKSNFLPLCTLGRFFAKDACGPEWLRLRASAGLGLNPAFGLKTDIEHIGTHSVKCTILSWMHGGEAPFRAPIGP